MAQLNFENIRLVVADVDGQIREEIKSIVHHEGFRDINVRAVAYIQIIACAEIRKS